MTTPLLFPVMKTVNYHQFFPFQTLQILAIYCPFQYPGANAQIYLTALNGNAPPLALVRTQLLYCAAWLISTALAPEYASCFAYVVCSWLF